METSTIATDLTTKPKRTRNVQQPLKHFYDELNDIEIGIDEAGRGPLFGRLYVAGAVLPKFDADFKYHILKDSKKFHSPKKIKEVEEYIKTHAIAWHVSFAEAEEIDAINIRQAVLKHMRECCRVLLEKTRAFELQNNNKKILLLVDGNDFPIYTKYDEEKQELVQIPATTVEGGDNTYCSIASASILAKVARDEYIEDLCTQYPDLDEKYGLRSNKGYGTRAHLDGIKTHGITQWHRKSYAPCMNGGNSKKKYGGSNEDGTTSCGTPYKKNWSVPY